MDVMCTENAAILWNLRTTDQIILKHLQIKFGASHSYEVAFV